MTDREALTQAIDQIAEGDYLGPRGVSAVVDAVLAAIGDRLLPNMYDFVVNSVVAEGDYSPSGIKYVCMIDRQIAEDDWETREAEGPTIPAAIRNALETDR